jgi:hypothetical protein
MKKKKVFNKSFFKKLWLFGESNPEKSWSKWKILAKKDPFLQPNPIIGQTKNRRNWSWSRENTSDGATTKVAVTKIPETEVKRAENGFSSEIETGEEELFSPKCFRQTTERAKKRLKY